MKIDMTRTLFLWLPPVASIGDGIAPEMSWLRAENGVVTGSGITKDGVADWEKPSADAEDERLIALAPGTDAPVQWRSYPDAAPAQAAAAARIDVLRDSLGEPEALHVASGAGEAGSAAVPVAVTTQAAMQAWTRWMAEQGLVPAAMIPAASLLPPPEAGTIRSAELPHERLLRTDDRAFASDPDLDALILGERPVEMLGTEAWRAALLQAAVSPPVDLLSGAWGQRQSWGIDPSRWRWIKRLFLALVIVSLAVPVIHALRLKSAIDRADTAVLSMASKAEVKAMDAAAAETALDNKLDAAGGGPLAFSIPASALYLSMRDVPGVALKTMAHRTDGTLSTTLAAPRMEDINSVLIAIQARGYRVTAQPMAGTDGQQMATVTIRAVP